MSNKQTLIALLATSLMVVAPAFAGQLLAPQSSDQVPRALVAAGALEVPTRDPARIEHQTVRVSRPLDASRKLAAQPQPHVAESRGYWMSADGRQLQRGVRLATTAPRAVVRVSPVGQARVLTPADLEIEPLAAAGKRPLRRAASAMADADELRAAGMRVAPGAMAFVLAPKLGSGQFRLSAGSAEGHYLIHVLDAQSDVKAKLSASRATVLDGQTVTLHLAVTEAGQTRKVSAASGIVVAPDGTSFPLEFEIRADGRVLARFEVDAEHSRGPELWRAQAFVEFEHRGASILRDVRTAFAVSAPTARFTGDVAIERRADGLRVGIGMAASHASRFEVSGVLYGSAADGSLQPAALAQTAAWREPGEATLTLRFSAASLAASGLEAPWQLRDLRLVDQGTMQLVERRSKAYAVHASRGATTVN